MVLLLAWLVVCAVCARVSKTARGRVLKNIERHPQIPGPVRVFCRQFASFHVDLQRRNDEPGHGQATIPLFAQSGKGLFVDAITGVYVCRALFCDGAHKLQFASAWGVVVAHEQASLAWQAQYPLNGSVKSGCVAAWKVGAGRAGVRHENRVTDKSSIADQVRGAGRRVSGRMQHQHAQRTYLVAIAVTEEPVEL